jgi:hypothetical protein
MRSNSTNAHWICGAASNGFAASALALIVAWGCSRTAKSSVSGAVTVDGQPLANGQITFVPVGGASPTAGASIVDGKYKAEVPPGETNIRINAAKITGKRKAYETPDSPTVDVVEELLPARYNARTELKMTVTGGAQEKSFDLKSK